MKNSSKIEKIVRTLIIIQYVELKNYSREIELEQRSDKIIFNYKKNTAGTVPKKINYFRAPKYK